MEGSQEYEQYNELLGELFERNQVLDIKSMVNETLDIFTEILEKPLNAVSSPVLTEINKRLKKISEKKWEPLRERLADPCHHGYGEFTRREMKSPAHFLWDLLILMDKGTQSVLGKLKGRLGDVDILEAKVKQLEAQLSDKEDALATQKGIYTKQLAGQAGMESEVRHLKSLLEEKNARLLELQKADNVQLWELEKKRLLHGASEKIESLEQEIEEIKQGRERYKHRMATVEASYRKLQLKQKKSGLQHSAIMEEGDNADDLSRRNFIQDKDIACLERDLYQLQTSTVGILGGMKTDFDKMSCKFVKEDGLMDRDFENLSSRMGQVYHAMAEGDLEQAKQSLPAHYNYLEDSNFKVRRVRRVSQAGIIPPQNVLNTMLNDKKRDLNDKKVLGEIKTKKNPVIVIPENNKLHSTNPLRYFPHMAQRFILDQYDKFKEFDRNGDGSLDLPEVVRIVSHLGFDFNAHQLQDAMEEVDMDDSHTLDFYEYLLVIDKIYRRNGKAELFKEGLSLMNKNPESKSCIVQ